MLSLLACLLLPHCRMSAFHLVSCKCGWSYAWLNEHGSFRGSCLPLEFSLLVGEVRKGDQFSSSLIPPPGLFTPSALE